MIAASVLFNKLRGLAQRVKSTAGVCRRALADPRTPRRARWLLGLAAAYAASPVDIIPDFIPVLGYLDDIIIVGGLVMLAMRMIPAEVLQDCREKQSETVNT